MYNVITGTIKHVHIHRYLDWAWPRWWLSWSVSFFLILCFQCVHASSSSLVYLKNQCTPKRWLSPARKRNKHYIMIMHVLPMFQSTSRNKHKVEEDTHAKPSQQHKRLALEPGPHLCSIGNKTPHMAWFHHWSRPCARAIIVRSAAQCSDRAVSP